ncbi:hypothetical protein INT47_000151 [Mucor saturninus]|uniref:Dilute domain-containing protein n=1 Tax=Mucor saturninus TaxID=64648 RepID=A0A8H7RJX6_9FUNG|nr:hypothetical protein INT47_000151 [Mucor saturninus]
MDSSKIAALGSPKPPTIASRRPMLSSQRSFSALSINTNTTHGDMMRRNSSATTASIHRRLQTPTAVPPLPLSANSSNSMSPEELSSKIADSFQQFSSMLSQLSSNKPAVNSTIPTPVTPPLHHINHQTSNTKTNSRNIIPSQRQRPKTLNTPPPTSKLPPPVATQNDHRKEVRLSSHPTVAVIQQKTYPPEKETNPEKQFPQSKDIQDSESEIEEEENFSEYNSHAIYFGNIEAVINEGNTELRRRLISKWLSRAASIGDLEAMQLMLDSTEGVDINFTSDKKTGITCLMYASYFGHAQCLNLLLKHPSVGINQQDKKGWTALMWAINSHQIEVAQILLNHGAEKSLTTKYGRTVYNFPTTDIMKELLGTPPMDQAKVSDKSSDNEVVTETMISKKTSKTPNVNPVNDLEYYATDGYSHFLNNHNPAVDPRKKPTAVTDKPPSPPDFSQLTKAVTSPQQEQRNKETLVMNSSSLITDDEEEDIKRWETSIKSSNTFLWDRCLPDQMFVFSQEDISFLLDQALNVPDVKLLMNKSQLSNELWQPANIIFLSTRFAHYCSSRELLNLFLETVATRLAKLIKTYYRDINSLAYWIANICQLSSYLKKDPGLSVCTHDAQETLSELISEAYSCLITESQKKIEKLLESSMLEYESIHELEQVEFVDDWQRFFRRSSSNNSRKSIDTASSIDRKSSADFNSASSPLSLYSTETSASQSPQSITKLLTNIQSTLQAYHVPPAIEIQAMAQFFHYLSCELFNRVLAYKRYLCRSKALQIRMNLSAMEEWVRINHLPPSLNNAFEPLVQLLQLLQCLSQMDDILIFSSTVQTFDKLNPLQVKRCVQNYRYEVSEPRLSEAVEQLSNQMAQDHQQQLTLTNSNRKNSSNSIQTRSSMDSINITNTSTSNKGTGGRPGSVSSLNCLLTTTTNKKRLSSEEIMSINSSMVQQLDDEDEQYDEREEKRNSKYLLPFSIPVTTALLQGWSEEKHKKSITNTTGTNSYSDAIYQEIKQKKQEQFSLLDRVYPAIAEEWIYNLDKRLHVR